jgi:site-specific DNA-methyltransferase (adenine-specific)
MGVGSCGVACVKHNRNFIGVEKDKKYCDIAVENIQKEMR